MHRKLKTLLHLQLVLLSVTLLAALLSGNQLLLSGLAVGGLTAIATTLAAMRIFRHLPRAVPARAFYTAMVINELVKWVLVVLMFFLLLPYFSPLAMLIGFAVTYMAYFGLIFTN